jgi:hypothetical protein
MMNENLRKPENKTPILESRQPLLTGLSTNSDVSALDLALLTRERVAHKLILILIPFFSFLN